MLVNREVILAKIETTPGVDAVPGVVDAMLVEGPTWSYEGLRQVERPAVRRSIGMLQQIHAGALRAVSFTCEIKGSGTEGVAPEIGVLMRCCACEESIVVDTSVSYLPRSADHESLTLYYYQDGKLNKLVGAVGTVSAAAEVGSYGKLEFNFVGHSDNQTDAALPVPVYSATVPPPVIGAGFSVGSYAAVINNLSLDLGNEVATPADMNSSDGYGRILITSRNVTGSFDPEDGLIAVNAFEAQFRSSASMPLMTGVIGAVAGNRWQIDMPAIAYQSLEPGDRDGVRTFDIGFGAHESAGNEDDEFTLTFT